MSRLRPLPTLAVLLAAAAIPVMYLGAGSPQAAPTSSSAGLSTFAEILSVIQQRHVPVADDKKLIYSGIQGMLQTLDPHTHFYDEDMYREMREDQRGSFFGLGIVISKRGRHQPLRVVSPIPDTPAARMGIRAGDIISHIRDPRAGIDVETFSLTIQEAVKYLRGPQGSPVEVTIERAGFEGSLSYTIERDAVQTPAVTNAFMVAPGVGYLRIANFTETTTADLDRALEHLRLQGAKRLVLDLQGNPGGLLNEAISVASRFLSPDQLVVYTEGRLPGSRQDYASLKEVPRVDWPLAVLIDRGSASASEIVSGAIQDHDRGLVIGETSFGKGLVQSVYPLSESTGLALTTQKYYTPAGRCIQRPYSSEEEYLFENAAREEVPTASSDAPIYKTTGGRTVYGGGGITPDIAVSTAKASDGLIQVRRVSAASRFVTPLSAEARAEYSANPEQMFRRFAAFCAKEVPQVTAAQLEAGRSEIQLELEAELALVAGGMSARDRVFLTKSPVLTRALESFEEYEQLIARRDARPTATTTKELKRGKEVDDAIPIEK
jgi:carboxyl-terminal processing protease